MRVNKIPQDGPPRSHEYGTILIVVECTSDSADSIRKEPFPEPSVVQYICIHVTLTNPLLISTDEILL